MTERLLLAAVLLAALAGASCGGGGDSSVGDENQRRRVAETAVTSGSDETDSSTSTGPIELEAGGITVYIPGTALDRSGGGASLTSYASLESFGPAALPDTERFLGGFELGLETPLLGQYEAEIPLRTRMESFGSDRSTSIIAGSEVVEKFRIYRAGGDGSLERLSIDRMDLDGLSDAATVRFLGDRPGRYLLSFIKQPPGNGNGPDPADNVQIEEPESGELDAGLVNSPTIAVGERGEFNSLGTGPSRWSFELGRTTAYAGHPVRLRITPGGGEGPYTVIPSVGGSAEPAPLTSGQLSVPEGEFFELKTTPNSSGELNFFIRLHDSGDPGKGVVLTLQVNVDNAPVNRAPEVELALLSSDQGEFEVRATVDDPDFQLGDTWDYQWSASSGEVDPEQTEDSESPTQTVTWTPNDSDTERRIEVTVADSEGEQASAELVLGNGGDDGSDGSDGDAGSGGGSGGDDSNGGDS